MFGVTGAAQSVDQPKTQTELEMEAGRRAVARHTWRPPGPTGGAPAKSNGGGDVVPFPAGDRMARGAVEEPTAHAAPAKPNGQGITNPALDFLNDFFGTEKRHLVAIKKTKGKGSNIRARHFEASDRAGQQEFIVECSAAGFDLYFSPNPIKGTLHKKATKNDVAEARYLWVDLDPRPGEPIETERAAMLARLTTNLPPGIPRPNYIIDSGRGSWGFWKVAEPQPVGGELTEVVESHGCGIEQAFGAFADDCHNIDRVARLPGTINTKAGIPARVLCEYSHDTPHAIESFPRADKSTKPAQASTLSNAFKDGPAPEFGALANSQESLSEGIEPNHWFAALPPERKDEAVDYALGIIAKNTSLLELGVNGGNNNDYYRLTTSVARSGAPNAEEIFVKYALQAKDADSDEMLRQYFGRCKKDADGQITVGTLLLLAQQNGAGFDRWRPSTSGAFAARPGNNLPTKLMQESGEFVANFTPPEYLIDGFLQRRFVYSITGPTGSGKTCIALLFAVHVRGDYRWPERKSSGDVC